MWSIRRLLVLQAGGRDYRLRQLQRDREAAGGGGPGGYFLWPRSDPTNVAAMEGLWRDACAGEREAAASLEVFGRRVEVARACNGSARFGFEELCGDRVSPLGPHDFLAIGRAFDAVFLDDIPAFHLASRNQVSFWAVLTGNAMPFFRFLACALRLVVPSFQQATLCRFESSLIFATA